MKQIPITTCRVCSSDRLEKFLSLGLMPPINKFPRDEAEAAAEELFPLETVFCPQCTHVQLSVALDPEETFSDYLYFSSNSRTFVEHGAWLATTLKDRLKLAPDDMVVEVASNDGVFLKSFKALPTRVLGVEPARNIAAVAERDGIPTVVEFFGEKIAADLRARHGAAKLIIGANVLAHAFNLPDFVRGLKALLAADGTVVIEVPYVADLIVKNEFDTIYHEHLSYFSVTALAALFTRAGLAVYDVEYLPHIHGGSLMVSVRHENASQPVKPSVGQFLQKEKEAELDRIETYQEFARRVERLKTAIPAFIRALKDSGKAVVGYGAAAKGNVLLQYCGIDRTLLPYILDKSPHKHNHLTPGSHIPVIARERIADLKPDYLMILAWNFAPEIMQDMRAFAETGGKFLVPLPEPRVI